MARELRIPGVDNQAIARALVDLADLHELSGTIPFKVRAFRSASRAIEGFGGSVSELAKKDELSDLRGVGDGVARRIKELLETGKIAEAEALRAQLPPGLLDLMNLPGIGLKTAQQVWKERNITTVDELEKAAQEGLLRDLPRFGQKREEKLVIAISAWKKRASQPKRRPMAEHTGITLTPPRSISKLVRIIEIIIMYLMCQQLTSKSSKSQLCVTS